MGLSRARPESPHVILTPTPSLDLWAGVLLHYCPSALSFWIVPLCFQAWRCCAWLFEQQQPQPSANRLLGMQLSGDCDCVYCSLLLSQDCATLLCSYCISTMGLSSFVRRVAHPQCQAPHALLPPPPAPLPSSHCANRFGPAPFGWCVPPPQAEPCGHA